MVLAGVILGAIYGIVSFLARHKTHLIFKILVDCILTIATFCTFIFGILYINLGEFRLFLLIGYALGLILERLTLGKIFAKGYIWVYNKLEILCKRFKSSKFGGIIFK